jgi:hypothetical protein
LTTRAAIRGATYRDNIIYAWGVVPLGVGGFPRTIVATADFGVANIVENPAGTFTVTLFTKKEDGTTTSLGIGAVAATIYEAGAGENDCLTHIDATDVAGGTFTVYTSVVTLGMSGLGCQATSEPFQFIVTGRP